MGITGGISSGYLAGQAPENLPLLAQLPASTTTEDVWEQASSSPEAKGMSVMLEGFLPVLPSS
jgi:hypothetical protein